MTTKVTAMATIEGEELIFEVDLTSGAWPRHPDPVNEAKNLLAKEVAFAYKQATGAEGSPEITFKED